MGEMQRRRGPGPLLFSLLLLSSTLLSAQAKEGKERGTLPCLPMPLAGRWHPRPPPRSPRPRCPLLCWENTPATCPWGAHTRTWGMRGHRARSFASQGGICPPGCGPSPLPHWRQGFAVPLEAGWVSPTPIQSFH